MTDLKKRTITAIILFAIIIPIVFFGGIFIELFGLFLAAGASFELERMFKKDEKWSFINFFSIFLSALSYLIITLSIKKNDYSGILVMALIDFVSIAIIMIFKKGTNSDTLGKMLISILYPSIGFSSLVVLRNLDTNLYRGGLWIMVYMASICFFTDCFAYFFGCKFGKTKLCPEISPKKSWEGSIWGTIFGTIFPTIIAAITGVSEYIFPGAQIMWAVILTVPLSLALSFIDEIGDLFASKLKRSYGLKDYSQIFPGHGGILDRFDSYIYVSALLLLFITLVY